MTTAATSAARTRTRFRPTRAGIVNLWDYRDEEFVFAGGRLVLRGPNGSGKTKALEVLFPFVLDGRIEPRRLNPFASEDRTMRSNLLYRGQSSGYGYVWMEFGTENGEAVTVGIGLQASRHTDKVKRWYFVVDGRAGVDFSLLTPDDRPLTRKQLIAEVGADAVRDNPAEHRAAVDARLFGLGRERFDQLLTLVLTLRRPQLAKNLDPGKLSDTLSDGLRPLDDHLLVEAARSFDDMEAVARTLEGLVRADEAAATFLTAYTTYLRAQARTAADALGARRATVADGVTELGGSGARLVAAQADHEAAARRVREAELAAAAGRGRLEQLKESDAYKAHEQLDDLQKLVAELTGALAGARSRHTARATARRGTEAEAARAGERVAQLRAEAGRLARELADDAADAGIAWSADDAQPSGFDERVAARGAARDDDLRAVRRAVAELGTAEHSRRLAADATDAADATVLTATAIDEQAAAAVDAARSTARQRLAAWADRHAATVAELGVPVLDALARAVDGAGEADATDPRTEFARLTAEPVQAVRDELARLRDDRRRRADDLGALEEQRRAVAAERDDAPGPNPARPAPRAGRAGAPLWRLVRFAAGVDDTAAAGVEAALEAAALLDAWVHPADDVTATALDAGEADGYLVPLPEAQRPHGPTLASVLEPDDTELVPAARVRAVLSSIALLPAGTGPAPGQAAVSVAGRFGQGVQVGTFTKQAAGFVGATARARRRAARLAELDALVATSRAGLDDVDRLAARTRSVLDAVQAAAAELPRVGPIVEALRRQAEAAGALRSARAAADAALAVLDQAVAAVGARDRELRRIVADRRLGPDSVEAVGAAVARFGQAATRLTGVWRQADAADDAAAGALARLEQAADDEAAADDEVQQAATRSAEESERLAVLSETMGAEARDVLARIEEAKRGIATAEHERASATAARERATAAVARAEAQRDAATSALATARTEERAAAQRLEPFADDDVLRLLRCPAGLRWPARHDEWDDPDGALPAEVAALHEAILAATSELRPTEATVKQATTRLSRALDELSAELSAAGHEHRPEWAGDSGIILVRVVEESGPVPIGVFAERIAAARRDQELLLTDSERRVLEDALLTQLARQIHERTVDARDLIARMNREMQRRRMSSGITVGVRWELSDALSDEHRAVVGLLGRDAAQLGPDELTRMRGHFAGSIKAARAAKPDRAYRELLGEVLDYRRWRTFAFFLHPAGGGEERLTRARHGQLSGGEQSVSLHLPLFAAAHAMFDSASRACPRLLALDEAFAGVDDKGRTELFGLAAEFDFDLVMTGYDLWATYATVPAAAHYDLSHSPAEHAVSALLMVWDGRGTDADVDGGLAARLGSPQTRRRPGPGTGLLDDLDAELDAVLDTGAADDSGEESGGESEVDGE